jgi:acetylornithine deacetylase/succinyl-diaminopimelate desuccinylase-like protein
MGGGVPRRRPITNERRGAMSSNGRILDYIDSNRQRFLDELFEFLRIPSVSASSEHKGDTRRAAEWLMDRMKQAGLETSIHDTAGHPIVLGEWRGAGADAPTVLIYGHYDVQPPEPLDLWTTPAFEPQIRDGRIYARGSVDDKGQLYLHVKALEAHLQTSGSLPVNVVLIAEGEEEVGSENLMPFVEKHADRLKADAIVISDSGMFAEGMPTIGASLRGLAYFEIRVRAASERPALRHRTAALSPIPPPHWRASLPAFHDDNGHILRCPASTMT